MRTLVASFGLVLLGALMLAQTVQTVSHTTPEREAARCRAHYRLSMGIAEMDYNDCMRLFDDFGKCVGEGGDEVSAYLDDLNDCLRGAGVVGSLPPEQGMEPNNPLEVTPVAPHEAPSPGRE
jgi:hypothetical protein